MKKAIILGMIIAFLSMTSISLATQFEVDENTVALWRFNEGSGDQTFDETSNDNDGAILGEAAWTNDSISGTAIEFDGIDDRISIVKTPSVDLTEQVTMEAWIKRTGSQDGTIFSRNGPFFIAVKDNKLYGGIHTSGGAEGWAVVHGTSVLELNKWYYVMISYNGSLIQGYVNGTLEDVEPKSGIMVVRSQQPWIGWGEPGQNQFFKGIIDEVRISDIARTISEPPIPPEPECNCTELTERVSELEERFEELENRIGLLESLVNALQNTIRTIICDLMPKGLLQAAKFDTSYCQ